jgi:glycosyltransferase involved in cell wall biosynthesis
MKFSLIGPVYPYRGGIAHYTTALATALHEAGHSAQIISFRRQYPAWLYPGKSDRDPSKSVIQLPAEYILDPFNPWSWYQASEAILREKPDLTVIQWWTTFWAPAYGTIVRQLRKQGNRTVSYLIHNTLPHEARSWDPMLAKFALQKAHVHIVQTESEKEKLISLLPDANIHLSKHPVYQPFSDQHITQADAREQLDLPEQIPVFLFFGIVRAYKGLKYLLEAISQLGLKAGDALFLVAGEFWEDIQKYQLLVEQLGIGDLVRIDNRYIPNEEADLLFRASDALIAPYRRGTQSGVASLAIGYKLPLIITSQVYEGLDAAPETEIRIVPPGDSAALAEAIQALLKDIPRLRPEKTSALNDWQRPVALLEELAMQTHNESNG